jgi:hypothetical protein
VTSQTIKQTLAPMMFQWIHDHLNYEDDIQEIVLFMDHYHLTPAHISEHLQGIQALSRQDLLKNISSSTKSKLTKFYNKHHESTKFKKRKQKAEDNNIKKFDPVLDEFENLRIDDDDED